MKKHCIVISVCGAFALSLVACGEGATDTDDTSTRDVDPLVPDEVETPAPTPGTGGSAGTASNGAPPSPPGAGGASGSADAGPPDTEDSGSPREPDAGRRDAGPPDDDSLDATQEGAGEPCDTSNTSIVLPEGGSCALSEEQQALFGLFGFDTISCDEGRVSVGGISGGSFNFNGFVISCARP